MEQYENAKKMRAIYFPNCEFPEWVLEPNSWQTHAFNSVKVYYDSVDDISTVKKLMTEREPCNMGLMRFYNKNMLRDTFGYQEGAYRHSTRDKLMPNIAVYTHATVKLRNEMKKVHVVNLIGAALDRSMQPDFMYFCGSGPQIEKLIQFYRKVWAFALHATKQASCKNLQIYNVGGGAFAGPFTQEEFIMEIFEPAMKPLLPLFKESGISIVGYDWTHHRFTAGYIPDCLETHNDIPNTMFVNAWDPWSLIGNGNGRDNSLDGHWGRVSNMAILGWLPTNPHMAFIPINFE